MKYCIDTWFILKLFEKDIKAVNLLQEVRYGKSKFVLPISVYAESFKKLLQKGISQKDLEEFFSSIESIKIEILLIDKIMAKEAAKISLSNDLSMMDSFVATSCNLSNCDVLLAADSDYDLLIKKKYLKLQSW